MIFNRKIAGILYLPLDGLNLSPITESAASPSHCFAAHHSKCLRTTAQAQFPCVMHTPHHLLDDSRKNAGIHVFFLLTNLQKTANKIKYVLMMQREKQTFILFTTRLHIYIYIYIYTYMHIINVAAVI